MERRHLRHRRRRRRLHNIIIWYYLHSTELRQINTTINYACVMCVYLHIIIIIIQYVTCCARARFAAHEFLELEGGSVGT